MSYTKLQYIAYVLDTNFQPAGESPACYRGLDAPVADYTKQDLDALADLGLDCNGPPGIAAQDIAARVALVKCAIDTANNGPALGGSDTLKIFMMPEFFFRGTTGAYGMDSVQAAVGALRKLASDDTYTDWLFVFGTIVGSAELGNVGWSRPLASSSVAKQPSALSEIYNFSLVQRGGTTNQRDGLIVMKEFISDQDFIPRPNGLAQSAALPPGMLFADSVVSMVAGENGTGRENQVFSADGRGIFDCAGIRFGMEICLDHAAQRLSWSPQTPGDQQVQVQLVSSCGMSRKSNSLILDGTGYVFCCDGKGWGATASQPLAQPPVSFVPTVWPLKPSTVTVGAINVPIKTLFGPGYTMARLNDPGQGVLGPTSSHSESGAIVAYAPLPVPSPGAVPGQMRRFLSTDGGYHVVVTLFYDDHGNYVNASVTVDNAEVGLFGLAQPVPMALNLRLDGVRGQFSIEFTKTQSGDSHAISCTSDLPGFGQSGRTLMFGPKFQSQIKSTLTEIFPAGAK